MPCALEQAVVSTKPVRASETTRTSPCGKRRNQTNPHGPHREERVAGWHIECTAMSLDHFERNLTSTVAAMICASPS